MHVVLIHGLGRTPLSMRRLARRLRRAGHHPLLFGYAPTFETLDRVVARLRRRIATLDGERYALAGHSLGSVIIRAALADTALPAPAVCFFLAPPVTACKAACHFSRFRLYRWLAGDMGRRLADPAFMDRLPWPPEPVRVYVGVRGPRAAWLPFRGEPNDGILSVSEATGAHAASALPVAALHTFIMNAPAVVDDIVRTLDARAGAVPHHPDTHAPSSG